MNKQINTYFNYLELKGVKCTMLASDKRTYITF